MDTPCYSHKQSAYATNTDMDSLLRISDDSIRVVDSRDTFENIDDGLHLLNGGNAQHTLSHHVRHLLTLDQHAYSYVF